MNCWDNRIQSWEQELIDYLSIRISAFFLASMMSWLLGDDIKRTYMDMPMLQTIDKISPCFHREFINEGYRVNYNFTQTFLSLFTLHNETMNIWSHLIAFICTLIAGFTIILEFQGEAVDATERILIGVYITSAAMCMLLSTLYHWFSCMSEEHFYSLLSLDLTGIACLIAGSYFPGTYYGKKYFRPPPEHNWPVTHSFLLHAAITNALSGYLLLDSRGGVCHRYVRIIKLSIGSPCA